MSNSIFGRFCQFVKQNPIKGALAIAAIVIGVAAIVVGTVLTAGALAPVAVGGMAAVFGAIGASGAAGATVMIGGAVVVAGTVMAAEYSRKRIFFKKEQERVRNAINKNNSVSGAVATSAVHNSESDVAKTLAGNTHSAQAVLQQGAKPANPSIWKRAGRWVAARNDKSTISNKKVELQALNHADDSEGEGEGFAPKRG